MVDACHRICRTASYEVPKVPVVILLGQCNLLLLDQQCEMVGTYDKAATPQKQVDIWEIKRAHKTDREMFAIDLLVLATEQPLV